MIRLFKACIGSKIAVLFAIGLFAALGVYTIYALFSSWYSPELGRTGEVQKSSSKNR